MSYVDNWPYGQCTWRVALYYMIPWSGNAMDWTAGALANGWQVGSAPHIGDIAVFQPGDNGASSDGHVAIVTNVNGDGTAQVWEQNVTFGTAAPDSRQITLGTGTQFITPPVSARTDQFGSLFSDASIIGGPASSQATLADDQQVNPLDFFSHGIIGTVGGAALQGVSSVVASGFQAVFVFFAKSGEVIVGLALLAFGGWVLVKDTTAGRMAGKSYSGVVKEGVKAAVVGA